MFGPTNMMLSEAKPSYVYLFNLGLDLIDILEGIMAPAQSSWASALRNTREEGISSTQKIQLIMEGCKKVPTIGSGRYLLIFSTSEAYIVVFHTSLWSF